MTIKIDVHVHGNLSADHEQKLNAILERLGVLKRQGEEMAVDLTALKAAVQRDTEVDAAAITLLTGLKAKIDELIASSGNTVDPAELQALSDAIGTSTQGLADAVTANTPVAP